MPERMTTSTMCHDEPKLYCFVMVVGSFQLKMLSVRQRTQHFTNENKVSRK